MRRAGREPAEDVKRRLVAACQEVGLTIQSANMIRQPHDGSRVILVGATPDGWPFDTPMLTLTAEVSARGDWTRTVDVRCVATEDDTHPGNSPWLQGRGEVPLSELIEQLRETLAERAQVLASVKQGDRGPFVFARSVWKIVDLLAGLGRFGDTE